jgi:hypothetical protein
MMVKFIAMRLPSTGICEFVNALTLIFVSGWQFGKDEIEFAGSNSLALPSCTMDNWCTAEDDRF